MLSRPTESRWSRPLRTDARLQGGHGRGTRGKNARQLLEAVALETGDDSIALSMITVLQLAHGVARADTVERRERRQRFLDVRVLEDPRRPGGLPTKRPKMPQPSQRCEYPTRGSADWRQRAGTRLCGRDGEHPPFPTDPWAEYRAALSRRSAPRYDIPDHP